MAYDPLHYLRNAVIYEIFVRNHTKDGTFSGVTKDLDRIRSMGVDIIWLMPIHPIGKVNKKGSLGCPYSISDYLSVNPEYGTLADFKNLIDKTHELGMKLIIDVVFNHTSHDSLLVKEHPEFFHCDSWGQPCTSVPEWSDVIDLNHSDSELTTYLIDSLKYWASMGVDGFRCDVASLVPVAFWQKARRELHKVRKDLIWLAESVHAVFVEKRRMNDLSAVSDSELYTAFDLTYDYDIWPIFQTVVSGQLPVKRLLEMLRFQEAIYPKRYIKMRCVENHDTVRIQKLAPTASQALAWTGFQAFNKGACMVYAGQEAGESHTPSLFEHDPIRWDGYPLQPFITKLTLIKKHPLFADGKLILLQAEPLIQAAWRSEKSVLYGIFNVTGASGKIKVNVPDGNYANLVDTDSVMVSGGTMDCPETIKVFEAPVLIEDRSFYSELLDANFSL